MLSYLVFMFFLLFLFFFFFKQNTAYELRISDWSSDVCSSDLASSPGSRIAHGNGPWSMPSARAMPLAVQRRDPATISNAPGPQLGRTISGWRTPRERTVGRREETSGAFFA